MSLSPVQLAMTDDGAGGGLGPRRQAELLAGDGNSTVPVRYEALETAALEAMPEAAAGYVEGGAGGETTLSANRAAFDRWRLVPRVLRDVSDRDTSVEVLGTVLDSPVVLAPIGNLSIVHDDAERAIARGASEAGLAMVLSTVASTPLEAVATELETAGGTGWFQLYWNTDREVTASLVDRAEAAGYEALVVTVDTPVMGWRERDLGAGYLPFDDGDGLANYTSDPAFRARLDAPPEADLDAAIDEFSAVFGDPSLTWTDIEWLTDRTDLPVLVKGVLHPADAAAALEHGADGIVVSTHGGRQLDRAIPPLDALPAIRDRVGPDATVLLDSGIRRGVDAVVAVALGADAVLLGRPYVYGLTLAGADGVRDVCRNVRADFDVSLGLTGHTAVGDLDRSVLDERPR
jgi:isopentenyl diphosphate isomerase/L-lactate dehydrogenase-like FMN-dependent dehydrogenase